MQFISTDEICCVEKKNLIAFLETLLVKKKLSVSFSVLVEKLAPFSNNLSLKEIQEACQDFGVLFRFFVSRDDLISTNEDICLVKEGGLIRLINEKERALLQSDSQRNQSDQDAYGIVSLDILRANKELFIHETSQDHWFWSAFRQHWGAYVQGGIAAAFINIFSLIGTLYSMLVYDRVLPSKSTDTLVVLTTGVIIIYLFDLVMKLLRSYVLEFAANAIDKDMSEKVFFQGLSVSMESRPRHIEQFISELKEHETVREFMMSTAVFILSDAPFLFLFFAVIAWIGGKIVFVPIIIALILGVIIFFSQMSMRKYTAEFVKHSGKRSGFLIESVEGAETIKTLNAEYVLRKKWRVLTDQFSDCGVKIKRINNFASNLAVSAQSYIYVGVIGWGAVMVQSNELTPGALIACSLLSSRSIAPLSQLISILSRFNRVLVSVKTIDKIMNLPVDRQSSQEYIGFGDSIDRILLKDVEYTYPDAPKISLIIPQFELKAGERVAVLGKTGSGKSTFLKILSGLYRIEKGRILVNDIEISHIDPIKFRNKVGYLPQEIRLFEGTLRSNLTLGNENIDDAEIIRVATLTGLGPLISNGTKGFDMPIFSAGQNISSGQRQAVGICRSILAKPKFFLLDEPTSSIDQQTEIEFIKNFAEELKFDDSLVVVTHKPQILSLVSRIILIDDGKIVMDGSRDMVLAKLSATAK